MTLRCTILLFAATVLSLPVFGQTFNASLRKANKQYELHAYNLAIPSYEDAIKRRSDDAEALGKLADCYRHLNRMNEAADTYARAVRQKDVDKVHILGFGLVLKALGRYDEAKQWFLLYARDADAMVGNHFAQGCDFAKSQLTVTSSYTVTNEFINTTASEFGPAFYGQQQVVFSSARTDIQRSSANWAGKANNQLFLANIGKSIYLESPVFLRSNVNNEFNQGPLSFSPDGRTVAYTRNNFVDGTRQIGSSGMELSLYTASINTNGDWVDDKPVPFNGTGFSTGYPCFSPDGSAIYFSSNRPDGFGGYDIYVSYRTGNTWSTPENLGPVVNSPGDEVTPYYDGVMLFFSSDWHDGLGGYDVFRAESTNNRWTKIYHLGSAVNSPADDYGFLYDSFRNIGYVVSNRTGGRGNEDIYRVQRSADYIVIKVKNATDGTPIPGASLDFSACGEGVYQADNRGMYSFQAVQGLNCNILVKKEGYLSNNLQVATLGGGESREYEVTLSRSNDAYAGKILDYTTRRPLDGVLVAATNQSTSVTNETTSNASGDYYLALSPYVIYNVRFSRPGYKDFITTVRPNDGLDRTILGVVSMLPAVGGPVDIPNPEVPDPNTGVAVSRGYAVQVAAVSSPNLGSFENLANLGTVYYKSEDNKYKIRVGVFETRSEAEKALKTAKTKGYKGAFIVQETGGGVAGANSNTVAKGDTGNTNNSSATTATGKYRVQLAAYRDATNFDDSKIRSLGPIEEAQKGQFTVKYIGGFSSVVDARQAMTKARAAGFKEAFVVEEVNGQWKKAN